MNSQISKQIIEAAGGARMFARLLGIDSKPGFQQRVHNWKRRGIPDRVALTHFDLIRRLEKAAQKNT